jgi:hypothetical protein
MNKDITPENDKGKPHGYWERYYTNKLAFKCFFHNGNQIGYEELYPYPTFKLIKIFYIR